jgi:hypothetical protein
MGLKSSMSSTVINRVLKNVMSAGKTRQNPTKTRRLCVINEHFEEDFNAVLSSATVFQQPVKGEYSFPPRPKRLFNYEDSDPDILNRTFSN